MDLEQFRWELFLQICNKQDLDIKGEQIKDYKSNFRSAFMKAHNIAAFYTAMENEIDGYEKR